MPSDAPPASAIHLQRPLLDGARYVFVLVVTPYHHHSFFIFHLAEKGHSSFTSTYEPWGPTLNFPVMSSHVVQ
eukprot:scaffold1261_cov50-Cyclotella_meneghiniana.AAC.13